MSGVGFSQLRLLNRVDSCFCGCVMRGLIQRVSQAQVTVDNEICGAIDQGLLLLLGVQAEDDEQKADKLLQKVLSYHKNMMIKNNSFLTPNE